ncbi:S-adenosyl-L-methionine-dependent methyltransferase [Xylariales sp. PMI_506]|nr:S-adenosyl-L-methionine-dependent methyltransferase [Xylariales sp. PMI_506]
MDPELIETNPSLKKIVAAGANYVEWRDGREEELLKFIYAHPSLPEMRNNPRRVCEAIDEFSAQHDFLISISSDKGLKVVDLIAKVKPKTFVELGGYLGYSAILFADEMRKSHGSGAAQIRYWSLEADPLFASIAMNLIDLAGLSDVVKVVTGFADASLKRLVDEKQLGHIDMLFLDHVEKLYHTDLETCEGLGLLKKGAYVVADNVKRPGAPEYRKYVRAHPNLETSVIEGLIVPGNLQDEIDVSIFKA